MIKRGAASPERMIQTVVTGKSEPFGPMRLPVPTNRWPCSVDSVSWTSRVVARANKSRWRRDQSFQGAHHQKLYRAAWSK